jgi:hypothetical protein
MGALLRVLLWTWHRISDAFTLSDLLDLFDLKSAVVAALGFVAMMIFGATNYGWSAPAVVLASLIAAACVSVIFIAARITIAMFKSKRLRHLDAPGGGHVAPQTVVTPTRDVGVGEAIAYIGFREWGKSFFDAAGSSEIDGNTEYRAFLQAAADGDLTVWGQRGEGRVYAVIPASYWVDHEIEWFGLLKNDPHTQAIAGLRKQRLPANYRDLMTSRAEIARIWPPASPRLELARIRADGVAIRNAGQNVIDGSAWIADTQDWMVRAIVAIRKLDEADAEWFKTLDTVPPPRVSHNPAATPAIAKAFREHDLRLARLDQLIFRYADRDHK